MARVRLTGFGIGSGFRLLWVLLSALGLLVTVAACSSSGDTTSTSGATATPGAASAATGTGGPQLTFKETERDFGPINRNQKTEYRFAFTNTGLAPLQIGEIRAEPIDPSSCA